MKLRTVVVAALCIGLVCGIAAAQGYAQGARVTVYNPMGTPPPIPMKSMAPRIDTLDGKTIFLVQTGFPNSREFMQVMQAWFKDNHPKVNTVLENMSMSNMPAALRARIEKEADIVFFGLGH